MQVGGTCCMLVELGAVDATWGRFVQRGAFRCRLVKIGATWCSLVHLGGDLCNLVHFCATW